MAQGHSTAQTIPSSREQETWFGAPLFTSPAPSTVQAKGKCSVHVSYCITLGASTTGSGVKHKRPGWGREKGLNNGCKFLLPQIASSSATQSHTTWQGLRTRSRINVMEAHWTVCINNTVIVRCILTRPVLHKPFCICICSSHVSYQLLTSSKWMSPSISTVSILVSSLNLCLYSRLCTPFIATLNSLTSQ